MILQLMIFDLDGTLYPTDTHLIDAVAESLRECSLPPVPSATVTELIGKAGGDFCRSLLPPSTPEGTQQQFHKTLRQYEKKFIAKHAAPFPGVPELLATLSEAGWTLALCSNGSAEYMDQVISACGIKKYFRILRSAVPYKGKKNGFRAILEELSPAFALAVGDRLDDREAAEANGLPFIHAAFGYGGNELSSSSFQAAVPAEIAGHAFRCRIFQHILEKVRHQPRQNPCLIGVNGVDTSGKSHFSESLCQYLRYRNQDALVIHLDDFHNPRKLRNQHPDPVTSYIDHAFNLSLLEKELLLPMKTEGRFHRTLQLLDLDSDTFTRYRDYSVAPETIVILEGVLLYRPPLLPYFDLTLFLDIDFSEVLRRAAFRDVPLFGPEFLDRYRDKYIPIQQWYLSCHQPKETSHILIDNKDWNRPRLLRPQP